MPAKSTSTVTDDQPAIRDLVENPNGSQRLSEHMVLDPGSLYQSSRRETKEAAHFRKTLLECADEYELLQADYHELLAEKQRLLRSGTSVRGVSKFAELLQEWMPIRAEDTPFVLAPSPQQETGIGRRQPVSTATMGAGSSQASGPQIRFLERVSESSQEEIADDLSLIHLDIIPQERLAHDPAPPQFMEGSSSTSLQRERTGDLSPASAAADSKVLEGCQGVLKASSSSLSLGCQEFSARGVDRTSLKSGGIDRASLKSGGIDRASLKSGGIDRASLKSGFTSVTSVHTVDAMSRTLTDSSTTRTSQQSTAAGFFAQIASITSNNFTDSLSKKWAPRMSKLFPSWFDPEEHIPGRHSVSGSPGEGVENSGYETPKARCVLGPVSKKRLCWDLLATICLLFELWTTPFELIFVPGIKVQFLLICSYSITAFFTFDIILNFSTGYIHGTKSIIMQRSKIIKHYLRGWFIVDLIATIPLDLILASFNDNFLAAARLGKGSKMLKTVRYLKLIRAVRMVRTMNSAKNYHSHFETPRLVRIMFIPLVWAVIIMVISHFNACLAAALQPEWADSESVAEGLMRYFDSFTMAYVKLIGFTESVSRSSMTQFWWLFECLVASERIALLVILGKKMVLESLSLEEHARLKMVQEHALRYLRRRNVSFRTQLEVLYSIQETAKAQDMQKHFKELTTNDIPMQLRRTISQELWSAKLLSLGLIMHIAHWNDDFVNELALLVREEIFPTHATVFRQGEAAIAAYCVIEGEISVLSTYSGNTIAIPDFTAGMWLGEKALVNPLLRRSASVTTKVMTMVMAISATSFQDLLNYLGLTYKFQSFCSEQLWRGLCGRCGVLGDHFADNCPKLRGYDILEIGTRISDKEKDRPAKRRSVFSERMSGASVARTFTQKSNSGSSFFANSIDRRKSERKSASQNQDLKKFLVQALGQEKQNNLLLVLKDMDIESLEDLENTDSEEIRQKISLSAKDLNALSQESIAIFREKTAAAVHQALFQNLERNHYLVFLSHAKKEAGTEAALLRTELMKAIAEDPGNPANNFDVPVFLDSEDLQNLSQIQERVGMSHNLVVLLTSNVLTRPWVLVELVTASRQGLRVLPVRIDKPSHEFEMPTEAFYTTLVNGDLLSVADTKIIKDCGADLPEVSKTIRQLFNRIMIPYSPHRSEAVRQAEVGDLLKQCGLKVQSREDRNVFVGRSSTVGPTSSSRSSLRRSCATNASLATYGSVSSQGNVDYSVGAVSSERSSVQERDFGMISSNGVSFYNDRAI